MALRLTNNEIGRIQLLVQGIASAKRIIVSNNGSDEAIEQAGARIDETTTMVLDWSDLYDLSAKLKALYNANQDLILEEHGKDGNQKT